MNISNLIWSSLVVMVVVTTGQLSGAANSEGLRINQFPRDSQEVSPEVGAISIFYLRNSQLYRLRVHEPVADTTAMGRYEYVEKEGPITASPVESVSIAQILNANPFRASDLPTARKWLGLCVSGDGIYDLTLDQDDKFYSESSASDLTSSQGSFAIPDTQTAEELIQASTHNRTNLEAACHQLPRPANDAQRYRLAALFGEDTLYLRRTDPVTTDPVTTDPVTTDLTNPWSFCSLQ